MSRDIRFMGQGQPVAATSNLPTFAVRTHAQLTELARDPTPDRCDQMIRALAEVSAQVHRLRTELERRPQ